MRLANKSFADLTAAAVNKKFCILVFAVFAVLAVQIAFLQRGQTDFNQKAKFVNLTGFSSFAFGEFYARHIFSGEINDIFGFYPGFRESEISSFLTPNLGKIYE